MHRVLVVDPAPVSILAASFSRPEGLEVEHVRSGQEALARLEDEPAPTAVVIELDDRDADVPRLVSRVRHDADGTRPRLVVVAGSDGRNGNGPRPEECDAYFVEPDRRLRSGIAAFAVRLLAAA